MTLLSKGRRPWNATEARWNVSHPPVSYLRALADHVHPGTQRSKEEKGSQSAAALSVLQNHQHGTWKTTTLPRQAEGEVGERQVREGSAGKDRVVGEPQGSETRERVEFGMG